MAASNDYSDSSLTPISPTFVISSHLMLIIMSYVIIRLVIFIMVHHMWSQITVTVDIDLMVSNGSNGMVPGFL